jgi:hypothetical protein
MLYGAGFGLNKSPGLRDISDGGKMDGLASSLLFGRLPIFNSSVPPLAMSALREYCSHATQSAEELHAFNVQW